MKTNAFSRGFSRSALALLGLVVASAIAPAQAQNGLVMRNIFGKIGLLPEEKDPIEYRERPALVVPKSTEKLRQPEPEGARTKANSQWPVDPDVQERKREQARRNQPIIVPLKSDPSEGGRLSLQEMARGRSARGVEMGESGVPLNDKAGVRLSIQEMTAPNQQARAPSYPPGTEPPRQYLTDPPTGLRIPSAAAPSGKKTTDDPTYDSFKVDDAWKRID